MTEKELLARLGLDTSLWLLNEVLREHFEAAGMRDVANKIGEVLDRHGAGFDEED